MYISAATTTRVKAIGDTGNAALLRDALTNSISEQQTTHWDLLDALRSHGWLRAAASSFGRTIVGAGMTLAPNPEITDRDPEERRFLKDFYMSAQGRDFTNLSDFQSFSVKMKRTAGAFHLFGHAAWELRENGFGEVVSYDVIPGFIWPNCDTNGQFKDPPFQQYLNSDVVAPLELDPDRIVFFTNPDFGARPFATDFEALAQFALPTDIYLTVAMMSLLKNMKTPLSVYSLDAIATQDDIDAFTARLDQLYKGADKFGSSAVAVRGDVSIQPITPPMKDLPFQDGHSAMMDEIEGVSGVHGAKLGRTSEVNRSNMREARRDYWETTLQPVGLLLTEQMHLQIHQRIFGIEAWVPRFLPPDFLTQVEKATVAMRGRQWGALTTNEFRTYVFDLLPIGDDWANSDYLVPQNMTARDGNGEIPPEEPVVDEPNTDSDPPVRGDTNNTEEIRAEIRAFANFTLKRWGQPHPRPFEFRVVPQPLGDLLVREVSQCTSRAAVNEVFETVFEALEEG